MPLENDAKELRVGVFGFGNVGSTIAAVWLRAGASVLGYDISNERVNTVSSGNYEGYEENIKLAFAKGAKEKRFELTSDPSRISRGSDIKFIAVPVYLGKDRRADLYFLKLACETVGKGLKEKDTVIITPSLPPGTTRNIVKKILDENSALKGNYYLVYSPERIFVGRAVEDMEENYPAVVSGIDKESLERGQWLFQKIARKGTIVMSSLEEAEFEKLAEGVYRDVNIALANELALACSELGIDYYNVRNAANSQPFSKLHLPGFGVGGACIPVYPIFVSNSLKDTKTKLIAQSREINDAMVEYLVEALRSKFHVVSEGKRIGILGLAFRGDVADARLSQTYSLVEKLEEIGVKGVLVHDPKIKSDARLKETLTSDFEHVLQSSDILIIATDHSEYKNFDWESLVTKRELALIDGKGILRGKKLPPEISLYGLGYGANALILEN